MSALPLSSPPNLAALVTALHERRLTPPEQAQLPEPADPRAPDFADVAGQESAKRALEIAAAGGHNVLMVGPPGAGKTMLARRLPGILPALEESEALEVTAIHSVAGLIDPARPRTSVRPFRAPHHTISDAGLIGGGNPPRPGEVSLAHLGVLFLDELLEFRRHVMESLRQPMEDGRVLIARAAHTVAFPARFTLIGAMNPCPCGHAGDASRRCACAAGDILRYRARLSGPMTDRIDLHVHVGAVGLRTLMSAGRGESSAAIRTRVNAARRRQRARYRDAPNCSCNAEAPPGHLDAHADLAPEARALLDRAADRVALTARGYHRVLKVARTLADLDDETTIWLPHLAEALRYRPADSVLDHVAPPA